MWLYLRVHNGISALIRWHTYRCSQRAVESSYGRMNTAPERVGNIIEFDMHIKQFNPFEPSIPYEGHWQTLRMTLHWLYGERKCKNYLPFTFLGIFSSLHNDASFLIVQR